MTHHFSSLEKRRNLRKTATPQEIILWSHLRNNQLGKKFRRQHTLGNYIVDFYAFDKRLVIEIDGAQHLEEQAIIYDRERTHFLETQGCTVLRFLNNEINTNLDGVLMRIMDELEKNKEIRPSPQPSPKGRGG